VRCGTTLGGSPWLRQHIRQSQSKGSFLSKIPVDATAVTHDPGDALAKDRLPQYELKPRPPSPPKVSIMAKRPRPRLTAPITMPLKMFADTGLLKGAATGLPSAANSDDRLSLQSGKFHAILLGFCADDTAKVSKSTKPNIGASKTPLQSPEKQTIPKALLPRTSEIIEDRR
jgi:hypothetical protein